MFDFLGYYYLWVYILAFTSRDSFSVLIATIDFTTLEHTLLFDISFLPIIETRHIYIPHTHILEFAFAQPVIYPATYL